MYYNSSLGEIAASTLAGMCTCIRCANSLTPLATNTAEILHSTTGTISVPADPVTPGNAAIFFADAINVFRLVVTASMMQNVRKTVTLNVISSSGGYTTFFWQEEGSWGTLVICKQEATKFVAATAQVVRFPATADIELQDICALDGFTFSEFMWGALTPGVNGNLIYATGYYGGVYKVASCDLFSTSVITHTTTNSVTPRFSSALPTGSDTETVSRSITVSASRPSVSRGTFSQHRWIQDFFAASLPPRFFCSIVAFTIFLQHRCLHDFFCSRVSRPCLAVIVARCRRRAPRGTRRQGPTRGRKDDPTLSAQTA
jgi:hypothetical protein